MKKLIMLIGEPGSGKSTIVKNILLNIENIAFKHKLLRGYSSIVNSRNVYIFGIYFTNEIFEGTDKLSMGVQPSVTDFILQSPEESIFITEGDRLGNAKLLKFCSDNNVEYELIHIFCDNPQERRDQRGSKQSETWINSRKTKISNLLNSFKHIKINNKKGEDLMIAKAILATITKNQ